MLSWHFQDVEPVEHDHRKVRHCGRRSTVAFPTEGGRESLAYKRSIAGKADIFRALKGVRLPVHGKNRVTNSFNVLCRVGTWACTPERGCVVFSHAILCSFSGEQMYLRSTEGDSSRKPGGGGGCRLVGAGGKEELD